MDRLILADLSQLDRSDYVLNERPLWSDLLRNSNNAYSVAELQHLPIFPAEPNSHLSGYNGITNDWVYNLKLNITNTIR